MAIGRKFKEQLVAYVLADPLIEEKIATRLYSVRGDQSGPVPYVVYQTVSGGQGHAHDGATGLEEFRVQFSIFAKTSLECDDLRDLIKDRLDGFSGVWVDVRVGYCFFDNDIDGIADTANLKQKTIDFRFMASAS